MRAGTMVGLQTTPDGSASGQRRGKTVTVAEATAEGVMGLARFFC